MQTESFDPEYCKSLLHGRIKPKEDAVVDSIAGYSIAPAQKERIVMVKAHLDYVEKAVVMMDAGIDELVIPYESHISLLCSIPGIDRRSAITIISEIGTDINQFSSSKRLCRWAGLTPGKTSLPVRRNQFALHVPESTSNRR